MAWRGGGPRLDSGQALRLPAPPAPPAPTAGLIDPGEDRMADHDAADLSAGCSVIRLLGKPQFADPLIRRIEQDSQNTPPMVIEGARIKTWH